MPDPATFCLLAKQPGLVTSSTDFGRPPGENYRPSYFYCHFYLKKISGPVMNTRPAPLRGIHFSLRLRFR
jgi:hypothetical protein